MAVYCLGAGPWKITSLTLSAQPSRNINDEFIAVIYAAIQSGNVTGYVEFSQAELDVKINGLFLHNETVSYTDVYDVGDIFTFKYNNYVPSFAPADTYTLTFNFKDKSGAAAGCFFFNFKI